MDILQLSLVQRKHQEKRTESRVKLEWASKIHSLSVSVDIIFGLSGETIKVMKVSKE